MQEGEFLANGKLHYCNCKKIMALVWLVTAEFLCHLDFCIDRLSIHIDQISAMVKLQKMQQNWFQARLTSPCLRMVAAAQGARVWFTAASAGVWFCPAAPASVGGRRPAAEKQRPSYI